MDTSLKARFNVSWFIRFAQPLHYLTRFHASEAPTFKAHFTHFLHSPHTPYLPLRRFYQDAYSHPWNHSHNDFVFLRITFRAFADENSQKRRSFMLRCGKRVVPTKEPLPLSTDLSYPLYSLVELRRVLARHREPPKDEDESEDEDTRPWPTRRSMMRPSAAGVGGARWARRISVGTTSGFTGGIAMRRRESLSIEQIAVGKSGRVPAGLIRAAGARVEGEP